MPRYESGASLGLVLVVLLVKKIFYCLLCRFSAIGSSFFDFLFFCFAYALIDANFFSNVPCFQKYSSGTAGIAGHAD